MSLITQCDNRGRVYLGKKIREKYGETFIILEDKDKLILVPVSNEPIKDLEELGTQLPRKSLKALRKDILKEAKKEV